MKCQKCGIQNPDSNKFCCQCGTKLEVNNKCPKCGTTFPSEGIFCPECGTRVRVEQIEKDRSSRMDMCPKVLEFVVGSCRFKMIKVEGGTFTMGDDDEFRGTAHPTHLVTLSDYYIGQTEVTKSLWSTVMDNNPFQIDDYPMVRVSWKDCQAFIEKLNRLLSKELGGKRFALPTEAQWEFAARGGNQSKGYRYAGSDNIDDVAWYDDNSGGYWKPVARKQPNELGLYDMSGNVCEWCQDWYDEGYYCISPKNNPQGPASGTYRVIRGGSWSHCFYECRVSHRMSYRGYGVLYRSTKYIGFRLCLIP